MRSQHKNQPEVVQWESMAGNDSRHYRSQMSRRWISFGLENIVLGIFEHHGEVKTPETQDFCGQRHGQRLLSKSDYSIYFLIGKYYVRHPWEPWRNQDYGVKLLPCKGELFVYFPCLHFFDRKSGLRSRAFAAEDKDRDYCRSTTTRFFLWPENIILGILEHHG